MSGVADISRATATVKGDMKAFDATPPSRRHHQRHAGGTDRAVARPDQGRAAALRRPLSGHSDRPRAPTRATVGARVTIDPTTLRLGGGTVRVAGVVDPAASNLRSISPACRSAVDNFAPNSGVQGTLTAKAQVTGALPIRACRRPIRRPACASSGRRRRCAGAGAAGHGLDGRPARFARCPAVGRRQHSIAIRAAAPSRKAGRRLSSGRDQRRDRSRAALAGARPQRAQRHRTVAPRPHPQYRQHHHRLGHDRARQRDPRCRTPG